MKETLPIYELEGVPFEVNPLEIDRSLFQEIRRDKNQEQTRRFILEAFFLLDSNPEKLNRPFEILIPKKTWEWASIYRFQKIALKLGGHNADWVEQSLEWAQHIFNGVPWEDICNKPDNNKWFRVVRGRDGKHQLVGGAREALCKIPASAYYQNICSDDFKEAVHMLEHAVPLIVRYKSDIV